MPLICKKDSSKLHVQCCTTSLSATSKSSRVAQSVTRLTEESDVPGSMPGPAHTSWKLIMKSFL